LTSRWDSADCAYRSPEQAEQERSIRAQFRRSWSKASHHDRDALTFMLCGFIVLGIFAGVWMILE
jgi:hypothetical protein